MAREHQPLYTLGDLVAAGFRPHLLVIEDVCLTLMVSPVTAASPWVEHLQAHLCRWKGGSHRGSCQEVGSRGREGEKGGCRPGINRRRPRKNSNFLLGFDRFSYGTTPKDTVETDRRETGVGVFKLPSCSFAELLLGVGHRKHGCRSESAGEREQHTPSAGGGRAKALSSDSSHTHLSSLRCQACLLSLS